MSGWAMTTAQVRDHQIADIIGASPNDDQTTQEFWGGIGASLAGLGNAYAEKRFIGNRVVALEPLPINTRPIGPTTEAATWNTLCRSRQGRMAAARQGVSRPQFAFGKSDLGLSPLDAARQSLSISLATEEASRQDVRAGHAGLRLLLRPAAQRRSARGLHARPSSIR
jgi:phage portal protein BeeE